MLKISYGLLGAVLAMGLTACDAPHENALLKPYAQKNLIEQINLSILRGDNEAIRCANQYSDMSQSMSEDQMLACNAWRFQIKGQYEGNLRESYSKIGKTSDDYTVPTMDDWEDEAVWAKLKGQLKPRPEPKDKKVPMPKNWNFFENVKS